MEEQVYNVFPIMEKAVGYILGGLFIVSLPLAIREYISLRKFKKEMKEREKIRKEKLEKGLEYYI